MSVLDYDKDTGAFVWLKPTKFHPRMLGKEAGSVATGYRMIRIDGQKYKAHRLAWLYVYGEIPALEIDHKNGNKLDNRIANLRLATNSQNQANKNRVSGKKTPKGVRLLASGKYQARISFDGRLFCIGTYETESEAVSAYFCKASEHYGEFARIS
jgi:hypothetical protein